MNLRTIATEWGTFRCYPDDVIGHALEKGLFWDVHLRPFMDEAAGPGNWALDIGAYIGFHSVYLAARYQFVIAVEPVQQTFRLLRENCHANNVAHKVACSVRAAYDKEIMLRRAYPSEVGWDPMLTQHAPSVPWFPFAGHVGDAPEDYLVTGRVDNLLIAAHGPITFIKVDAQGCDLRVLYGLEETIRRHRPLIVLEWEVGYAAMHGDTWNDVLLWAEMHNYTVERITTDFWDYVLRPK